MYQGKFELGLLEVVLGSSSIEWNGGQEPLEVDSEWRCREQGEGEKTFRLDCNGYLSVSWARTIVGEFCGMYGASMGSSGRLLRTGLSGVCERSASDFEYEVDGYNSDAYEEERVGRRR